MDRGHTIESRRIGGVIRRLRNERALTLATVAGRTGLSPSFLSQLENGRTNTSLRSLQAIADVLSTTAADILAESDEHDGSPVARADDPSLTLDVNNTPAGGVVSVRALAHGRRLLRAMEFTGPVADDRQFHHPHDEIMYVVTGAVVATIGDSVQGEKLYAGDALYIEAQTLHRWRGLTTDTKVIFTTIAEDRRVNRL